MTDAPSRQPHILLAHDDTVWVDKAKTALQAAGMRVTDCPDPSWVTDLIGGSHAFELAAVSSALDAGAQEAVLRTARKRGISLLILLDPLDSSSLTYQKDMKLATHRITEDPSELVLAVRKQLKG